MPQPTPTELQALLDRQLPASVLARLKDEVPPELRVYQAEALLALDRMVDAHEALSPVIQQLDGDDYALAGRTWSEIMLQAGYIDNAILVAEGAGRTASTDELRAVASAWSAIGYSHKHCWGLAEEAMRRALLLAPDCGRVLQAQARYLLEQDERLQARQVYERMQALESGWDRSMSEWGVAYVAFLLGEFEEARRHASTALEISPEFTGPLTVLGQVALAQEDIAALQTVVGELARRSPQASGLAWWRSELARLKSRRASDQRGTHHRLQAFPSTVQRRSYCGPCTVELVLRYWKGGQELSNEQIAQSIKQPGGGTPTYRMREFFHLVGFDTVRCLASAERLKQLVDAGFPVIVEEEFSQSSHVTVMIGYDEVAQTVELQDPMTHAITSTPLDEFFRLRLNYLESAVVAFPRGRGHDETLARLGLFDEPALVWVDQAGLALDQNRQQTAIELTGRATHKLPALRLAWHLELVAAYNQWSRARTSQPPHYAPGSLAARLAEDSVEDVAARRVAFMQVLEQAKALFPEAEFVYQFEGSAALLELDLPRAQAAFEKACEIDKGDGRNLSSLAECLYQQFQMEKATDTAWTALGRDTTLPEANLWMARSLAARAEPNAYHYARCALDLAPDWWLAHLALGEAGLHNDDFTSARRELGAALALAPNQPEVRLLDAMLTTQQVDTAAGVAALEALLAEGRLAPYAIYRARQMICRYCFGSALYAEAAGQVRLLLELFPQDAWALQFLASAVCQQHIKEGHTGEAFATQEVFELYRPALQANPGVGWIQNDYLDNLFALGGPQTALQAAAELRQASPDDGGLAFTQGRLLRRAQSAGLAAQTMLVVLSRADGPRNFDQLYEAVETILDGLGAQAGAKAVLDAPLPEGGAPFSARQRALGLLLADCPPEAGVAEQAHQLLSGVLQANPEDSAVMLHLAELTPAAEREALLRQALLLSPDWSYARARLAGFLVDVGRPSEALEYSDGHEGEALPVLIEHGRGLLGVGRFEEAAAAFDWAVRQSGSLDRIPESTVLDPESLETLSRLLDYKWIAESNGGQHEAALETARAGLGRFPLRLEWYVHLAASLRSLERLEEAGQVIAEGRQHGLREADVLEAGYETARARRDLPAALELAEKLVALAGEQSGDHQLGYWEERRLRLLLESGQIEEARRFAAGEALDAAGWANAAWEAFMAGEFALCAEFAARALALEPRHFLGLYMRLEALFGLGQEAGALAACEELRQAYPTAHNAYEKLAVLRALEGELDEARSLAERAVELGSFCATAWAAQGYVYFLAGRKGDAQASLEAAWKRADLDRRRTSNIYWWLLSVLKGDAPEIVAARRQQAASEAKTTLAQRQLALIKE